MIFILQLFISTYNSIFWVRTFLSGHKILKKMLTSSLRSSFELQRLVPLNPKTAVKNIPSPAGMMTAVSTKEKNQKRNRFLKMRKGKAFPEYKRAKGRAKWAVKNAKRDCWQRFFSVPAFCKCHCRNSFSILTTLLCPIP